MDDMIQRGLILVYEDKFKGLNEDKGKAI